MTSAGARALAAALLALACCVPAVAALDLDAMWDFADPAASEARFRAALAGATPDEALVLHTQIARTFGLRRDFAAARRVLETIEPQLAAAGAEARARHALEYGRTWASAAHDAAALDDDARQRARDAFERAHAQAGAAGLDALAVDALHMLAFADATPEQRVRSHERALAHALASPQPAARAWEASLRHNLGVDLRELGRPADALVQFERALELRERQQGRPQRVRIARWMVARTLRDLGRGDEALAIQQRLEREWQAEGRTDPYVFEELAALHRARGEHALADRYARLAQQAHGHAR